MTAVHRDRPSKIHATPAYVGAKLAPAIFDYRPSIIEIVPADEYQRRKYRSGDLGKSPFLSSSQSEVNLTVHQRIALPGYKIGMEGTLWAARGLRLEGRT